VVVLAALLRDDQSLHGQTCSQSDRTNQALVPNKMERTSDIAFSPEVTAPKKNLDKIIGFGGKNHIQN
jgi:hypothetical protein